MRSDCELQIFTFRSDEWIDLLMQSDIAKSDRIKYDLRLPGRSQILAQKLTTRSIGFSNRNGIGLLIK